MSPSIKTLMVAGAALLLFPSAAGAASAARADAGPLAQAVATRAVRYGDRGDAVAALQRLLADAGFDPGPIDGIFGPLTEGAVRRAQTALGLTVDGLAGRLTLEALLQRTGPSDPAPAAAAASASTVPAAPDPSQIAAPEAPAPVADPAQAGPIKPDGELILHAPGAPLLAGSVSALAQPMAQPLPAATVQPFALTFNGDPDPQSIDALLAALAQHQMKATFFISGEAATRSPALVAKIAEAGHEVGNAGYGTFEMTRVTRPMMEAQLSQTQAAIAAAAGTAPRYFRPPQARWNDDLLAAAKATGLSTVLWSNITAQDTAGVSAEELSAKLSAAVYPSAVLMLHADRESTVQALDQVLTALERKGFRSRTLSDLAAVTGQSQFDTSLDRSAN